MFGLDQSESRSLHSTLMTSQNTSKGSRQLKYTAAQTFVLKSKNCSYVYDIKCHEFLKVWSNLPLKFSFVCLLFCYHRYHKVRATKIFCFLCCLKKTGQRFEFGNHLLSIFLCYCAPWNNITVVAPVMTVVKYLRCQFSWDRSWDYGKWYLKWRGHITPPKWPAGLGSRLWTS